MLDGSCAKNQMLSSWKILEKIEEIYNMFENGFIIQKNYARLTFLKK